MKRIVRGVCGLLSAVMLLSTTAMAADYTPVVTSDERVKGFYNVYNGENASLQMELAGRYNSGAMNADGGSLEIVQFNARNGFAYAVSLIVYQLGCLFTGHGNVLGIIVAVLLIGFICYMLFRPYKEAEHLSTKAKALAQK